MYVVHKNLTCSALLSHAAVVLLFKVLFLEDKNCLTVVSDIIKTHQIRLMKAKRDFAACLFRMVFSITEGTSQTAEEFSGPFLLHS